METNVYAHSYARLSSFKATSANGRRLMRWATARRRSTPSLPMKWLVFSIRRLLWWVANLTQSLAEAG